MPVSGAETLPSLERAQTNKHKLANERSTGNTQQHLTDGETSTPVSGSGCSNSAPFRADGPDDGLRLLFGECSGPFGARAYSTLGHHVLASFRAVPCSLPALPGAVEAWKFSKILASRVAIAIRKRITALQACKTGRPAAHVSCSPVSFPTFRKRTRFSAAIGNLLSR